MTVVCGHTHMPFTRLANARRIINPGSVGMPYRRQGAH
jgi:predicted phosphodiesterase